MSGLRRKVDSEDMVIVDGTSARKTDETLSIPGAILRMPAHNRLIAGYLPLQPQTAIEQPRYWVKKQQDAKCMRDSPKKIIAPLDVVELMSNDIRKLIRTLLLAR